MSVAKHKAVSKSRAILIVGFAVIGLWFAFSGRRLVHPLGQSASGVRTLNNAHQRPSTRAKEEMGTVNRDFAPLPSSKGSRSLNAKERTEVKRIVGNVRLAFEANELRRSKPVLNESNAGIVGSLSVIRAPTSSEISEMSSRARLEMADLAVDSQLYRAAYVEISKLYLDYVSFPKPLKFVALLIPSDPDDRTPSWGKNGLLLEYFAATEEAGKPTSDGQFPLAREEMKTDGDWMDGNSWARVRYSYLFSVKESYADEGVGSRR